MNNTIQIICPECGSVIEVEYDPPKCCCALCIATESDECFCRICNVEHCKFGDNAQCRYERLKEGD